MSYVRFNDEGSDVYVYASVTGGIECCACRLGNDWKFNNTAAIVQHLRDHIAVGHRVPDDVIPALLADAVENDSYVPEASDLG